MIDPLAVLLKRREDELRWKLASLPEELTQWRLRAANEQALRKNNSQIGRLSRRIDRLQAVVKADLDQALKDNELWLRAESLEKKALIVHTVWDQFRSRLSLRLISPFNSYLALADAYARECYVEAFRHLQGIASDQLCPAPLVTFDQQLSPWMMPESGEAQLDAESDRILLSAQQFQEALDLLPLTLVAVPWSYLTYLPHMALLAHELGHALERGADLTERLDRAIDAAALNEDHRPAWQAWRKEIFADWYGCAMGGPAFVWSLADYLANDQSQIHRQTRPHQNGSWTSYPTATVRILFCCVSLRAFGFDNDADSIIDVWSRAYPENPLDSFGRDFEIVVNAFCDVLDLKEAAYDGFRPSMSNVAGMLANVCRMGGQLPGSPWPARAYVTASRLLLEGPPANIQILWQKLRDHHLQTLPPNMAGAQAENGVPALETEEVDRLAATLFANV